MINVPNIAKRVPRGTTTKVDTQRSSSLFNAAAKSSIAPAQAALKFQGERDESKARQAFNAFRAESRDTVIGLKSLKGSQAAGGTKEYQTWYEENSKVASDSLDNGNQQEMFRQLSDARKTHDMDSLAVHESVEHQRFKESELQSSIVTGRFDAASQPFNKDLLNSVLEDNRNRFNEVRPGMDNSGDIARSDADVISAVILAQNEQDPEMAARTLEERKGSLGGAYEKLKAKVDISKVNQKSLQYANVIVAKEGDYDKQLALAATITDAELHDKVITRINAREQRNQRVRAAGERNIQDGLVSGIRQAPTLEIALDMAAQAPTPAMISSLRVVANSLHGNAVTTTNFSKLAEARQRIDSGDPALSNDDGVIEQYSQFVTPGNMSSLLKYRQSGGNKGSLKDSMVRSSFKQLTQKDPNKSEAVSTSYDRVWNYVVDNLEPGTIPTDAVVKNLVSVALTEGEREGGGFGYGEDLPYAEAEELGLGKSWLPDVDTPEENQIIPLLRKNNKSVTDKNIRLYKKHVIMGIPYIK